MGGPAKKSSLQGVSGRPGDVAGGGDPWRGLRGKLEVELPEQELVVGVEFGMAAEHERAAIGGGKVNIEHLDGGDRSRGGVQDRTCPARLSG